MKDTNILITGWKCPKIESWMLDQAPGLDLVAHSAGSVKTLLPLDAYGRVTVVSAAAAMAPAVAELALSAILMMLRRPHQYDAGIREGTLKAWGSSSGEILGREVCGSRLLVVGASRVGRSLVSFAKALGADVRVSDPYLASGDAADMGVVNDSLDALLPWCDVLSLHTPLTEETRGLIGPGQLALLRDGALVVNTARGALMDQGALLRELQNGRLNAALDVFEKEPLPAGDPLGSIDNVLLLPHMGAATEQARRRQGELVVEEIERFMTGRPLRHAVDVEQLAILA